MIEVRGLTKRYGEKVAVNDLTFGVEPGKVTGFLGPNGAGKTTTMRLILGLDYPDAGTVSVDGPAVQRPGQPDARGRRPARRQGGARRAQRLQPPAVPGADQKPAKEAVDEVLTLSGYPRCRQTVQGFSLGEAYRVGGSPPPITGVALSESSGTIRNV